MSLEKAIKNMTDELNYTNYLLKKLVGENSDTVNGYIAAARETDKAVAKVIKVLKPEITVESVKEALMKFANLHGREAAKSIMAKYDAGKLSDIKQDLYIDLLKDLEVANNE